jgi:hypothetical protein
MYMSIHVDVVEEKGCWCGDGEWFEIV